MSATTLTINQESITSARILLCEGSGDRSFFQELIAVRDLPDFYVTHPIPEIHPGGRGGFEQRLRSFRVTPGFDQVTGIIVVSDNDNNPNASFADVRRHIHGAGYVSPNHPFLVAAGQPAVAVMMLPSEGTPGQLETLCLESVKAAWPTQFQCAETYGECAGIGAWTQGKQERARLRALISHICRTDPNSSLTHLWSDGRELVIPLNHDCFNDIVDFLGGFDAAINDAE